MKNGLQISLVGLVVAAEGRIPTVISAAQRPPNLKKKGGTLITTGGRRSLVGHRFEAPHSGTLDLSTGGSLDLSAGSLLAFEHCRSNRFEHCKFTGS